MAGSSIASQLLMLLALATFTGYCSASILRFPVDEQVVNMSSHATEDVHQGGQENEGGGWLSAVFGKKKPKKKCDLLKSLSKDHIFVGKVSVGISKKGATKTPFKMIFDTASSDVVVMSSWATYRDKKDDTCIFNPTSPVYYDPLFGGNAPSDGNTGSMGTFSFSYNDGATYIGEKSHQKERVQIGPMVLEDMDLMLVKDWDPNTVCLRGSDYDGIIGLSRDMVATNSGGGATVVSKMLGHKSNVKKRGASKKAVFSFYISPDGQEGEVLFGNINKNLYTGKMRSFPVVEADPKGNQVSDWRLAFTGMKLGDTSILRGFNARFESTLQYGIYSPFGNAISNLILKESRAAKRLGTGKVVIDCDQRKGLQDLVLMIKKKRFSFTAEEYFPLNPSLPGSDCEFFVKEEGEDFAPDGVFGPGVPFMKKYYTVFESGRGGKIRMALAKTRVKKNEKKKERTRK